MSPDDLAILIDLGLAPDPQDWTEEQIQSDLDAAVERLAGVFDAR